MALIFRDISGYFRLKIYDPNVNKKNTNYYFTINMHCSGDPQSGLQYVLRER